MGPGGRQGGRAPEGQPSWGPGGRHGGGRARRVWLRQAWCRGRSGGPEGQPKSGPGAGRRRRARVSDQAGEGGPEGGSAKQAWCRQGGRDQGGVLQPSRPWCRRGWAGQRVCQKQAPGARQVGRARRSAKQAWCRQAGVGQERSAKQGPVQAGGRGPEGLAKQGLVQATAGGHQRVCQ
ncbi:heterogeneous nuclear ribonucleoprotein A1-like [Macrobrachium nipponense]|uniref:heterogeneous nuclear ribonucleoprotein A1-like n=1 Tax=Macrobrachium nipponense TaxID=159736 RepID=UPI0030C8700B